MFVAAVAMTSEDLEKLVKMGLKDSKKLTPSKRAMLKTEIEKRALAIEIVEVTPQELDEISVSEATILAMEKALSSIIKKVKPDMVIADVVGKGKKQLERLRKVCPNIIVESKADSKYPIVSAASIIAKETREEHVKMLKVKYGDFGSGYPSDPKTQEWIRHNPHSDIVRKKWKTVQRVLNKQSSSSS